MATLAGSRRILTWAVASLLAVAGGPLQAAGEVPAGPGPEVPAPEQKGGMDIYQVNREMFHQVNPAMNAEGFTTALIKKHMAMLMYPVDLGVLQPPAQDAKFQAQIQLFQTKLGVPATGVLTWSQFEILQQAATTATERKVLPPSALLVHREKTGSGEMLRAQGTWLGEGASLPLNYTEIICRQADQACLEAGMEVSVPAHTEAEHDYRVSLSTRSYRVTAWSETEVLAEGEDRCGPLRLSINAQSRQAIRSGAAGAGPDCTAATPATARLSAGSHEANRYFAARRANALKLSYEPFRP